jgi:hypothetical protein
MQGKCSVPGRDVRLGRLADAVRKESSLGESDGQLMLVPAQDSGILSSPNLIQDDSCTVMLAKVYSRTAAAVGKPAKFSEGY